MAAATPSKRAASDTTTLQPAKKTHWSQGLLASMNDPDLVVESDERMVIIKDKYPKARYHFLVIPKLNVPNLKSLKREQSELLRYMEEQSRLLAAKYPQVEFRCYSMFGGAWDGSNNDTYSRRKTVGSTSEVP
ncbi:hypothetical protein OTU49_009130 [Cherax quadricarinatus]|uniref:Aprataxin n=1 Tax=Cherax quadricarinatus TaxID=27406 RepID=A0AAW0WCM3_CHEQU